MPRQLNLNDEIKLVQAQMLRDPSFRWSFVIRPGSDLYLQILEACQESGQTQVSVFVRDVLQQFFDNRSMGGVPINERFADCLQALCDLWKVDAPHAVAMLFEKVCTRVLKEEIEQDKSNKGVLKMAHTK